ncbi:hypothetical protein BDN71DRAFT_1429331 [Pleurotus eryngii]|uniref:Metallo-beta-lactamase domain-containing protein n=1 Tax=Pleurotus eryngii TaxID=5323 RepID=A0A9P6D926_PLEER|nr:hypothetical protein BDN71DRAFT_1429331 [Pleurotus eryngii]
MAQAGGLRPPGSVLFGIRPLAVIIQGSYHTGDTSAFTKATLLLGDETETLLRTGYAIAQGSMYSHDLLPPHRTQLLKTDTWTPVGPSLKRSTTGQTIYLAADSAHSVKLFTGGAKVIGHPAFGPHGCAHADKELAELHISRIRELWNLPNVRVLLSHDAQWYGENRNGAAFWPGHIPSL